MTWISSHPYCKQINPENACRINILLTHYTFIHQHLHNDCENINVDLQLKDLFVWELLWKRTKCGFYYGMDSLTYDSSITVHLLFFSCHNYFYKLILIHYFWYINYTNIGISNKIVWKNIFHFLIWFRIRYFVFILQGGGFWFWNVLFRLPSDLFYFKNW